MASELRVNTLKMQVVIIVLLQVWCLVELLNVGVIMG